MEENLGADSLSISLLSSTDLTETSRMVYIEVLESPSIDDEEIMDVHNEPSWMDPILVYLRDDKLTQDKTQAQRIAYKATGYTLMGW